MLTETGVVKVMDFGIARVLGTEHLTQGGYMMGTPAYMAPEQVLGGEIDGRADLYAIGVVLYRLLSGQLPFKADTAIAMVQKQVNEPPTPIAQFQPDLPPWCERVLGRALAKSPPDRFQTADEFRAALLSAVQPQTMGELPTVATPTPPGLHVASDATRLQTVSGRSTQFGVPGGAAAVATPLAQTSPAGGGGTPVPPHPTSSTRPIDPVGHTTTVVLNRKHLIGMGLIATLIVIALVGAGWFAMRRSAFPPQMQIGAAPTEEAKPVEPVPAPPADQAPSAAAQPEDPGQTPPVPPPAPSAPVPPKPIDSAAGVTAGSPKPGGRAGTLPDGTLPAGARGARGTVPVPPPRSSRRRPLPRLRRRRPPHLRPLRRQPRHRSHSRTSGCS